MSEIENRIYHRLKKKYGAKNVMKGDKGFYIYDNDADDEESFGFAEPHRFISFNDAKIELYEHLKRKHHLRK